MSIAEIQHGKYYLRYHYQFTFAKGAGHVDGRVVGQTLPDTLVWLWEGYGAK
jgi:hypothetical protein